MKKFKYTSRDYIIMGLMVGIGIVLQTIDNMISLSSIPGGKLGLANIVSLINIFIFGGCNALIISSIRALLGSIMFGGASTFLYSFFGAVFSVLSMWFIKEKFYPKVSEVGISIFGAVMHNYGQLVVAIIIFQNAAVLSYSWVLTILAVISGFTTGVYVKFLNKRLSK